MTEPRRILMTIALPYANGALHLGHLVEAIQADIWARLQRMSGIECRFFCGSDAHGTPIMIKAKERGMTPEQLVTEVRAEQMRDFDAFEISFDNFYTTHSPENEALATLFFERLQARGDIFTKTIEQAYDNTANMFLPDRYIKGTCPKCKTADQYGDSCEQCGATYAPAELIDPVSVISKTKPIYKTTEHFFFDLPKYTEILKDFFAKETLQPQVRNKLAEWFEAGLKPWDISRDAPYFGFTIPGTTDKFFYVWLDAPMGYIASSENYAAKHGKDYMQDWRIDSKTELYHFIGKDITYFHALFWPAVLTGGGFRVPNGIFVHGFLTINGQKMSKSRGTFVNARAYLKHLDPDYLRYYLAAKLTSHVEDIDLNLEDFVSRVNADLVGKIVNIASRTSGFIHKHFQGQLASTWVDEALWQHYLKAIPNIIQDLQQLDYAKAIRQIMDLADLANQFIDTHKPWHLAKDETQLPLVQQVSTQGINCFRILIGLLKPIVPGLVSRSEAFLGCAPLTLDNLTTPMLGVNIQPFTPLLARVTPDAIQAILAEGQASA